MVILTESSRKPEYAELLCKTNYSFLRGASHSHEYVAQALKLGLHALAITDRDGVYGLPKAFLACKEHPEFKLITGAELTLEKPVGNDPLSQLTFLAQDRAGYGVLCRMITAAHAKEEKGKAKLSWHEHTAHMQRPGARGLIALADPALWQKHYGDLKEIFQDRLYLPLCRVLDGRDKKRTELAIRMSKRFGVPIVATNDVHYHSSSRQKLHDVLTSIREGVALKELGLKAFSNSERYLKSPEEMVMLFSDLPQAILRTLEVAERCRFSLKELRYYYPSEWIPEGETAQGFLEKLTWEGAKKRYGADGIPAAVEKQLRHELSLIDELRFADYFLTIWEVVDFARSRGILCQGRGSAANSAVCYCLGITAIDPVRMNLLFERFISAERGEPPDIDVDFESERREEVIQHIYARYGRDRAAMVSAVITYRSRLAIREVRKALGLPEDGASRSAEPALESTAERLAEEIYGFPRHLSIHSGGFTLSADALIETVPVEPARMEGRTIVQWDKYDLDAVGLLKVDILSLGMLTALQKTLKQVGMSLYEIPHDDPATYAMIQKADTVGVFQIESRAQMSMLPRLLPKNFYDLVIEVAIVRPGPIVGRMVHPFLKRRRGLEPSDPPDPRLIPILGKTLGVPLFQEQVMKMAVVMAGFTAGEADRLRRAIGAWRSSGEIEKWGRKLMDGLRASGLSDEYVAQIFEQLKGFAEYGFPESHAASFALLSYASSYLKCHHPAEFTCSLVNSQPMGFYSVHSLIDDARRHGVVVRPVDPNLSEWDCRVEIESETGEKVLRLGWRVVSGLHEAQAQALIAARKEREFESLEDFLVRAALRRDVLARLAIADAFWTFGYEPRAALWRILEFDLISRKREQNQLNLFAHSVSLEADARRSLETDARSSSGEEKHFSSLFAEKARGPSDAIQLRVAEPDSHSGPPGFHFKPMGLVEQVQADYECFGLSLKAHPMEALRSIWDWVPKTTTAHARSLEARKRTRLGGLIIVRQSPPTAKQVTFATLEDEHGFLDLILKPEVRERYEDEFLGHAFVIVEGEIQRDGHAVSMLVKRVEALESPPGMPERARDFR